MSTRTHYPNANTVRIDPDRFRAFFYRRRLPLNAIGGLFGRCDGWASVIIHHQHAGFYALDDLACALDLRVEDLIEEIGTDAERERNRIAS